MAKFLRALHTDNLSVATLCVLLLFCLACEGKPVMQEESTNTDDCNNRFQEMMGDSSRFPTDRERAEYLENMSDSCSGSGLYETRLAFFYTRLGRNDEARSLIERALQSPGEYRKEIVLGLADVEFYDRNFDKAATVAKSLTADYPDWSAGYSKLGQIQVTAAKFEEAISNLEKANSISENGQTYVLLTMAYFKVGNFLESAKAIQSGLRKDISVLQHTDAICAGVLSLVQLGYNVEAKELLEKHIEVRPESRNLKNVQVTADRVERALANAN